MTFIKDKAAFKTVQLFHASGYSIIAELFLRKAYGRYICGTRKKMTILKTRRSPPEVLMNYWI
ncbi:hypothetical protein C7078_001351 [Salmonella enterica]|uniref:Uncharacterized protein n=1 Tax=Salmonella diarizonae TaxID=59204 RepID=A0A702GBS3_SALDZ|nr:hypothetical protein [Salmonella enterica subsp. diarizonae]ECJ2643239.1 hypothetical protein [Salmonella enterica subsp. diarizonae]EDU3628293.1 hypothetical protein [Salmonella enterica]EEJ4280351.1 hypothetical protein [Salmonella enterica subsp. diarizonae]HAC6767224.1 hypothetical protein [Salmonella enterica subsp. diarizonae]